MTCGTDGRLADSGAMIKNRPRSVKAGRPAPTVLRAAQQDETTRRNSKTIEVSAVTKPFLLRARTLRVLFLRAAVSWAVLATGAAALVAAPNDGWAAEAQKSGPSVEKAAAKAAPVPTALARAAKRWKVNLNDVVIAVMPLDGVQLDAKGRSNVSAIPLRYGLNAERVDRPASTAKLVTTLVGLETLGAGFHWYTRFYADAKPDAKGVLKGNLYVRGGGDPTLVIEDFALQVDKLAQLGIKRITGNIVVDRSYFDLPPFNPAAFDGRSSRPYNLGPDAALMNYRNLSLELVPDREAGVARVVALPHMAGVTYPKTVKLSKGSCGDWKTKLGFKLRTEKNGAKRVVFNGSLPSACGAKNFNVIAFEPNEYFERVFRDLWTKTGGTWNGRVVDGRVPAEAERLFVRMSPSMAEVIPLINKWSNNTMARHVFLTLGQQKVREEAEKAKKSPKADADKATGKFMTFPRGTTLADGRAVVAEWLEKRGIDSKQVYIDNGSGLSRETRVTGRAMAEILAAGWQGPYWPEYAASLPITGEDGTMVRRKIAKSHGRIKTGFLRDVRSIGGYIQTQAGERYAVYASVRGSKNMPGGIVFLDNVIDWVYKLPRAK